MKEVKIHISNLGGNITALVDDFKSTKKQKVDLSKKILKKFKHIEQVGFIKKNEKGSDYTLHMAGGEFCGNAIRSVGLLSHLEDKKTSKLINLNGKNFKVEIKDNAVALYFERKDVILKNDSVRIDNILFFFNKKIEVKTGREIKAVGYIDYEKKKNYIDMKPYIYVKDIGSKIYEMGCASGSVALGLYLSKTLGNDIDIRQPCGEIYNIHIDKKYIILKSKLKNNNKIYHEAKM